MSDIKIQCVTGDCTPQFLVVNGTSIKFDDSFNETGLYDGKGSIIWSSGNKWKKLGI